MKKFKVTKTFKKDTKKLQKSGKNLKKLEEAMKLLVADQELPKQYRNHKLKGNFKDREECHIEPDWLLIYMQIDDIIIFERTGSHSELFE